MNCEGACYLTNYRRIAGGRTMKDEVAGHTDFSEGHLRGQQTRKLFNAMGQYAGSRRLHGVPGG